MPRLAAIVVAVLAGLTFAAPAHAQGVVFANSDPVITIHSTFTGQTITLFGSIEPGQGNIPEIGPYDAVVLVRGPASDRIVRQMDRQFGIMLNSDRAVYQRLPGYYAVLSSRPIREIASQETRDDPLLSLTGITAQSRTEGSGDTFDLELMRLMSEAGLFLTAERGVTFLSPTTFTTRILLPSSVPNGPFIAQVLILSDGEIVGSATSGFLVRTEGFERFLSRAARDRPFLYGLAAVLIAVATGWIGGVLFRR